jgi:drug/metabolite transporter (DMT)-like permease
LSLATAKPTRLIAIAEALIVNSIWASTFVLVKIGLNDLHPLTLSGLRYFGGFLLLLPLMPRSLNTARSWTPRLWLRLILIGVSMYTVGNGILFWGLQFMPATTGSFILNLLPLPVLFVGIVWLKEIPTRAQWVGIGVAVVGIACFFSPGLRAGDPVAIAIVILGLGSFVVFAVLGREVARDQQVDTLALTALPLAFGGGLALLVGLLIEGLPKFTTTSIVVVLWLALINTAFAYLLYNHSLQVLTAFEANLLTNLGPLITAPIAWIVLGETLQPIQIVGIVTLIIGVVLVEWRRQNGELISTT